MEVTRTYQIVTPDCSPVGNGAAYQQVGFIGRGDIGICLHVSVHGKITQRFPVAQQIGRISPQYTGGKINHTVAIGKIGLHIIKVETGGKGISGFTGKVIFGYRVAVVRNQVDPFEEVTLHFSVHFFQRASFVTGRYGGFYLFHIRHS